MIPTEITDEPEVVVHASDHESGLVHALKRWAPLLAKFMSIQLVVQALGLVAGVILVRKLSQRDYAYYTLANTMQATLLLLADIGIGSALTATGGKVWQDYRRFGELIQTGMQTRKALAWASTAIAMPALIWLLRCNHASWPTVAALCFSVMLGAWFRLTNDVLTIVPNIHSQIDRLQKLDLGAAIVRLIATAAMYLTYANSAIAVLIQSIVFGLQTRYLRKWSSEGADPNAPANAEDRQTIFRVIRQQAPTTIYYCVQGQLYIFMISLFGSTRTVAEVGALGRIAVIFTVLGTVMTRIVMPRFARCQEKAKLLQIWWRILAIYMMIAIVMVAVAVLIPQPFMWILGKKYAFAQHDLVWVVLGTVSGIFTGAVYQMLTARAWTSTVWLSIPITVCGQLALFHFLNLGTIRGVVLFGVLPALFAILPYYYAAYKGFKSLKIETVSVGDI